MIASAIDGLPELDGTSLSLETLNGLAQVMGSQAGAELEVLFLLQTFIVLEGAMQTAMGELTPTAGLSRGPCMPQH